MSDNEHQFIVPYDIVDEEIHDDTDTNQHKTKRGKNLKKRSIKEYSHASGKWGAALERFSPLWFAICISSGGLAIVLNGPFPYRGHWQVVISTILYVIDLVLFFTFLSLTVLRWIKYPHVAVRKAFGDPDELCAYAIAPIALLTLSSLTITQVSEGPWGLYAFTLVGYIAWWIAVLWVFALTILIMAVFFYNGTVMDRTMSATMFLAPVGLATAGAEAGNIVTYGHGMTSRLAFPMMIVAYFALGLAMFMGLMLYTVFFHRLMAAGWPKAEKRGSLFILVGPCAQFATALQILGQAANQYHRFSEYKPASFNPPNRGTFTTEQTAMGVDGAGILLSLLLLGFDYFWLMIALVGMADVIIKKQSTYSLAQWSIVFPLVTLTTAWTELAFSIDSPAFSVLVCILTVVISLLYLLNWAFTFRGIFNGSLIFGPTHANLEDDMMKDAQKASKKGDV